MSPETFRPILKILWCVGLWPYPTSGRGYSCWKAVCALTMIVTLALNLVKVYSSIGDLRAFSESMTLVLTQSNVMFKAFHLVSSHSKIRDLVERATAEIPQEYRHMCGDILSRTHHRIRTLGFTFFGSATMTTVIWVISPIIIGVFEPGVPWPLPLTTWYPFDHQSSSVVYWSTYTCQIFFCWVINFWYSSLTLIYIFLVISACSRFEMVSALLKLSGETAKDLSKIGAAESCTNILTGNDYCGRTNRKITLGNKEWDMPSGQLITQEYFKTEFRDRAEADMEKIWMDYVEYHNMAFRYVKELRNVFSLVVLSEVVMCLGIICQAGFLIVVNKGAIADFLKYSGYLAVTLFELLMYCWYGNEIIYQSSTVQAAAYDSPWVNGSPQIRAGVQMAMLRSQTKVALTAGGLHTVSLSTFTAILKNSYSLFALLRQISES